jgi:hypothetical protein
MRSVQERQLGGKLQINHHADSFIELKERNGLLSRQSFLYGKQVPGANLNHLFIDFEPTPHENQRVIV